MSVFKLPDLGEGLPEAEIHHWHVQVGEDVAVDQPLVSMETAKAVVEVPSPQAGIIKKCFGDVGDIIKTGAPLVEFESTQSSEDAGTVVGTIEQTGETLNETFIIGSAHSKKGSALKVTPALRHLAKQLNVDLASIPLTGPNHRISQQDIENAAANRPAPEGYERLTGARRTMADTMTRSHSEVAAVTIFDEVCLDAWTAEQNITVRVIQALIKACQAEPALNAWYDGASCSRKIHDAVNLGLAVDTGEQLIVPVLHNAQTLPAQALREQVDALKQGANDRSLSVDAFKDATLTLSNFGVFAGRFANPLIVPPTVAILGVGRLHTAPSLSADGTLKESRRLPLSFSFDHRAATGGEATRFLGAVIEALKAPEAKS